MVKEQKSWSCGIWFVYFAGSLDYSHSRYFSLTLSGLSAYRPSWFQMYRGGRWRAGTYETKMAARNVRCSIPWILRKNRGLWTVYRFVYLNIRTMRIFLLVLLNWRHFSLETLQVSRPGAPFKTKKRAPKIIYLKSLRGFYALYLKHQAKCKLLIVCISPVYHTSLLTMYYLKNTVLKTARHVFLCEFSRNQLSPDER